MAGPFMNVRQEPVGLRASLGAAFRSVAPGLLGQQGSPDEEFGSSYVGIHEEEAALGEVFQSKSGSFRSVLGVLKQGILPESSAREVAPEKRGLLHSLTPRFLRNDEDEDFASACCPHLGLKQRIFGCACCLCLGQVMQFCSFSAVPSALLGHPGRFACLYTVGNLVMLAASFFLSGPQAQCRKIKAKGRALSSLVYFLTMILTLATVFARPFLGRSLAILLLVAVQWMALVWYVLSFVPYGHSVGRRVLKSVFGWLCS